jgi:hypothetical protein
VALGVADTGGDLVAVILGGGLALAGIGGHNGISPNVKVHVKLTPICALSIV